jgi:hypothetical protein
MFLDYFRVSEELLQEEGDLALETTWHPYLF